jgi:hypothetical protein
MLWAIRAQEKKNVTGEKAEAAVEQLRSIQLKESAKKAEEGFEQTGAYCDFYGEHYPRVHTN